MNLQFRKRGVLKGRGGGGGRCVGKKPKSKKIGV